MRKPRDIDSELKALQDKAKGLKARKTTQLGELVAATGADQLDPETLAGVLLAAVETDDAKSREGWRRRGTEFFQRQGRARKTAAPAANGGSRASADDSRHAPG
jgi:hypothetical protein